MTRDSRMTHDEMQELMTSIIHEATNFIIDRVKSTPVDGVVRVNMVLSAMSTMLVRSFCCAHLLSDDHCEHLLELVRATRDEYVRSRHDGEAGPKSMFSDN